MKIIDFVSLYDKPTSIVLLEGKREVVSDDCEKIRLIGARLATLTRHIIFRSGNATGADQYFSDGVCSVDPKRMQVITPYINHRKKSNIAYDTVSLDSLNLLTEPDLVYQSKLNKNIEKLVNQFVSGIKDRNSIKAAYILRDTLKVIGSASVAPASFGIFYNNLAKPKSGGTGHTMNVCRYNNIPFIDQTIWFNWL